jgi:hypothetical protein
VVNPFGLSEPLSLAEKLAIKVAGLVVTVGAPVEVTTLTVPVIPQHDPCGVQ